MTKLTDGTVGTVDTDKRPMSVRPNEYGRMAAPRAAVRRGDVKQKR